MPTIKVWDNGGKTFDRYTVVINGDVFGMSRNANSPDGFNQYHGPEPRGIETLLNTKFDVFNIDNKYLGDPIAIEDLPEEVQEAIKKRVAQYEMEEG